MRRNLRWLAVLLSAFFLCGIGYGQTHTAKVVSISGYGNLGFYEFRPAGYGSQLHPLIIFLHGAGETGAATIGTELDKLLNAGIPKLIHDGASMTFGGNSFVVLSPQTPNNFNGTGGGEYWRVHFLLQYAKDSLHIDTNRIYVTGLSMGGGGTWESISFDTTDARQFAAAAPIASIKPYPENYCNIARLNIPIWAFHNDGDAGQTSPYEELSMLNQVNACTSPAIVTAPRRTFYAASGHGGWDAAYDTGHHTYALSTNPDFAGSVNQDSVNLYEWFLQNSRAPVVVVNPPVVGPLGYLVQVGGPVGNCGDTTSAGRFAIYGDSVANNAAVYSDSARDSAFDGGWNWYEYAATLHGPVRHDLVVYGGHIHYLSNCPGVISRPDSAAIPLGYIKEVGGPGSSCGDSALAGMTAIYGDSLADGVVLSPDPQRTNPLDGGYRWYAYSATQTGVVTRTFAGYADGSVHSLADCPGGAAARAEMLAGRSGVLDGLEDGLVIYPNPVRDLVTLHINSADRGKVVTRLISPTGKVLATRLGYKDGVQLDVPVSMSGMPAGVYIIELRVEGKTALTKKVLKL